jgi:hypothetical protein
MELSECDTSSVPSGSSSQTCDGDSPCNSCTHGAGDARIARIAGQGAAQCSPSSLDATPGCGLAVQRVKIAILGGGPVALAIAARLREPSPDASGGYFLGMGSNLRDTYYMSADDSHTCNLPHPRRAPRGTAVAGTDDIAVIDGAGTWLSGWDTGMAALCVHHLRSHVDAHPGPCCSRELLAFLHSLPPLPPQSVGQDAACACPDAGLFDIPPGAPEAHVHRVGDASGKSAGGHALGMEFVGRDRRFAGPFLLPSVRGFRAYAEAIVHRYQLGGIVRAGIAVAVERLLRTAPSAACVDTGTAPRYRVRLADGSEVHAAAVVVACGSAGAPNWPAWAVDARAAFPEAPRPSLGHLAEMAPALAAEGGTAACVAGRDVCIVGGGLSAVQLALAAASRGARSVKLLTRGRLRVRQFDLPVEWMAWGARAKMVAGFLELPCAGARLAAAARARGGGSITPEAARQLAAAVHAGRVAVCVGLAEQVVAACWQAADGSDRNGSCRHCADGGDCESGWELWRSDGVVIARAHCVWLATGYAAGIPPCGEGNDADSCSPGPTITLLRQLQAEFGGPLARTGVPAAYGASHGVPVLTPSLRWASAENVFVAGGLAVVQLGPDAGNLAGGRAAAVRLAACLRPMLRKHDAQPAWKRSAADAVRHAAAEDALRDQLEAAEAVVVTAEAACGEAASTGALDAALAARLAFPFRITFDTRRGEAMMCSLAHHRLAAHPAPGVPGS